MRTLALFFALTLNVLGANLVPNSSVEIGAGRGWQQFGAESIVELKGRIIAGGAFHGTNSINGLGTIPPPVRLIAATQYTFSWYEKANEANSAFFKISPLLNADFGSGGTGITFPTSWTRRAVQYTPETTDYYQIGFWHVQESMTTQIDAVQVEVGATATAYAPMATVEVGLETAVERNTFFTGDAKEMKLKWWNTGGSTSVTAYYEVFDLLNRRQASGLVPVTLPAGATTSTFTLPAINGWHRVTSRITNIDESWDELTCAVLPYAAESGVQTGGILGTHSEPEATQITFLRRCGMTWTRTLSPSTVFRWVAVEPTEDAYVWQDPKVTAFAGNGMAVLGAICGGLDKTGGPAWAHEVDGSLKAGKFADFCTDVVNHYKDRVTHWEIWNEPHQSGDGDINAQWIGLAANYAAMLTDACAAIKAEDPTAKIIAMGGVADEEWAEDVWDLLSAETKGQIDYISCHLYPNDIDATAAHGDPNLSEFDSRPSEWRVKAVGTKPIWNTETGVWSHGGHQTKNSIWSYFWQDGVPEWQRNEVMSRSKVAVERATRNFLRSIGNGFTKYFYYDSRIWAQGAIPLTTPYSWEYTWSLRPPIISLLIGQHFLDGYTTVARPVNAGAAELEMYLFEVPTHGRVAAVFNYDRLIRDITVSETAFTVYDVMGNAVTQPASKIRITKTPQYIVSNSLSVAQMTTMVQGAVALVADTVAPNVSIDIAPSAELLAPATVFLKWTGIDDKSAVHNNSQNVVQFQWRMGVNQYSDWGQLTSTSPALSSGNHTLSVRAKDAAGNISSPATYEFSISPSTRKVLRLVAP